MKSFNSQFQKLKFLKNTFFVPHYSNQAQAPGVRPAQSGGLSCGNAGDKPYKPISTNSPYEWHKISTSHFILPRKETHKLYRFRYSSLGTKYLLGRGLRGTWNVVSLTSLFFSQNLWLEWWTQILHLAYYRIVWAPRYNLVMCNC